MCALYGLKHHKAVFWAWWQTNNRPARWTWSKSVCRTVSRADFCNHHKHGDSSLCVSDYHHQPPLGVVGSHPIVCLSADQDDHRVVDKMKIATFRSQLHSGQFWVLLNISHENISIQKYSPFQPITNQTKPIRNCTNWPTLGRQQQTKTSKMIPPKLVHTKPVCNESAQACHVFA